MVGAPGTQQVRGTWCQPPPRAEDATGRRKRKNQDQRLGETSEGQKHIWESHYWHHMAARKRGGDPRAPVGVTPNQ